MPPPLVAHLHLQAYYSELYGVPVCISARQSLLMPQIGVMGVSQAVLGVTAAALHAGSRRGMYTSGACFHLSEDPVAMNTPLPAKLSPFTLMQPKLK